MGDEPDLREMRKPRLDWTKIQERRRDNFNGVVGYSFIGRQEAILPMWAAIFARRQAYQRHWERVTGTPPIDKGRYA